jgi:hypothetical protein
MYIYVYTCLPSSLFLLSHLSVMVCSSFVFMSVNMLVNTWHTDSPDFIVGHPMDVFKILISQPTLVQVVHVAIQLLSPSICLRWLVRFIGVNKCAMRQQCVHIICSSPLSHNKYVLHR